MSGFGWLIRDYCETRNGRIAWFPNHYRFLDAVGKAKRVIQNWDKKPWKESIENSTGRIYSLFAGRSAKCSHPEKWNGAFPRLHIETPRPYFLIPATDCKNCEFHEQAKRYGRNRYAKCRWFRENNGMDHPFTILEKSVEEAKRMIG